MEFSAHDHAWLFGVLAQEIRSARPLDFPDLLRDAVETCAVQRGYRMARAADERGFPRSMAAYLSCGELPPSPDSALTIAADGPIVWHVTACPWQAEWEKWGMTDVGRFYCRSIDRSLVRGFNPDLELTTGETLTGGDAFCYFRWNGASRADLDALVQQAQPPAPKPWDYHMAHLYKAVGEVLERRTDGDTRRAVFAAADRRLAERYGPETVVRLHEGLSVDYT